MEKNNSSLKQWTVQQALILMAVCLMAGVAGGWALRGARLPLQEDSSKTATPAQAAAAATPAPAQPPSADQLRVLADNQAAPMIARLKADPKKPDLLTSIGNLYYDAQQYSVAVDYYRRALQSEPSNASVRTDMATAYWYMGNADRAITEFNRALAYSPTNPSTLFNRGLVKWQGKHDSAGAIADWKKLLATNPHYEAKDKVEQMLSDVQKQAAPKPPTKG